MERCALCGEEFPSRPDFDRHVCRGIIRPARHRPSRWAIEVLFLTAVLAAAFIVSQHAAGASPLLVGSLFALYVGVCRILRIASRSGRAGVDDACDLDRPADCLVRILICYGLPGTPLFLSRNPESEVFFERVEVPVVVEQEGVVLERHGGDHAVDGFADGDPPASK